MVITGYKTTNVTLTLRSIHETQCAEIGFRMVTLGCAGCKSCGFLVFLNITCIAVAFSRMLRTALVPYGNMDTLTPHSSETSQVITMKLWNFACFITSVRQTHVPSLVGIRPLGVAPHLREIYTSCDFSSFLPSFLPSCLKAFFLAHLHRPNE